MSRAPVEIIAEIANAHQGEPQQADALAKRAVDAGADAVKFQLYRAEELLVKAHPRFEHFRRQAFPPEVWATVLGNALKRGCRVYCDVFGLASLAIAEEAGVHGIKVHSSDLGHAQLLEMVGRMKRRVLLAVGGSTVLEIRQAIRLVAEAGGTRPVLLHGFQAYPTRIEDACLSRLAWLREVFHEHCEYGYMDHVDGDDPFGTVLPILAIGLGASVIEKHITLDRHARGVDYQSSLNPDEFSRFVEAIRRAEQALGADAEQFSDAERRYRHQMKKHWVAAHPLENGTVLRASDLTMKRTESEVEVPPLEELVGRRLVRAVGPDEEMTRADVPQRVWALVVARMRSCRLPGKALIDLAGMPALAHLIERLKQAAQVHRIVVCTTTEPEDDPIARLAADHDVGVFRGATENVLARMLSAIDREQVDVVLRVTGDDLLVDPAYLDQAVAHHLRVNAQYTDLKALPSGTEVEVFDVSLLRMLGVAATDASGTEYLTTYIVRHRDQLRVSSAPVDPRHAKPWRLTLDTPEDLEVLRTFLAEMRAQGKAVTYRLDDIVDYFTRHPEILARNAGVRQRQTPPEVNVTVDWRRLGVGEHALADQQTAPLAERGKAVGTS